MNDDVVIDGHKIVHYPVNKHFRPEITVTLADQETVAQPLDFDNLATETQFAPDTLQSGRTLETTAEAISRSASPVANPKVHPNYSQLRKLRSNAAYKAVAELDTTSSRKTRASATSEVASGKRSPSFLARFAERISPAKSPPKVATKTISLASTVLGFFHTKYTPNGKSLEPEPEPPIQQSKKQSRQDIPDQGEQASVPNICDQEPEGEKRISSRTTRRRLEPIVGVEETNELSEVLDVDPRGETQCTVEEDDRNGTTDIRADGDFHLVCETDLDLTTGTVSQHNRLPEREGYLGINPELWDYIQTQRGSILPSFARSGRPIHSLEDGIAGPSTNISGGHSQPHPIPTSQQTEQRTARKGDQTKALPNQNPIETTAITGYHGTDITVIRVTTTSTAAVENPSTTDTSTTHRRPPYSATKQSAYKSTQPFPGTTVQVDSRRCCEPRSPTSSVLAQSQASQLGNLRFQLPVSNNNMAYCTSPTRAATVRDLDDLKNNQHTFSRVQLLPSFTRSPITRFDSWLESFENSKLQAEVKYKEFKDFIELVAATRLYAPRIEALETDREKTVVHSIQRRVTRHQQGRAKRNQAYDNRQKRSSK
ncbi:hypothetical protein OUZ56_033238 [Daphnia magna]|uniref:Uncharacterized protein n=1 Tax=Daphnia magna TaxID=35525 RepID=A0ABQ9ZYF2_9CRUS|nr:hypothetical protein OUZ56_033238 [Daphnia magna]